MRNIASKTSKFKTTETKSERKRITIRHVSIIRIDHEPDDPNSLRT